MGSGRGESNAGQMEQVSIVSDWRKAAPSKTSKLLSSFGESAMGQGELS